MLRIEGLEAAYGESRILFGIDFDVEAGEVVTLLGRNGMGKTTTVRSIFGLLKPTGGRVMVDGEDVTGKEPHLIARGGLGLVPEGRQIFPTLTVEENLVATHRASATSHWDLPAVYRLFPRLKERRRNHGDQISGGEQQMLAVGRALMTNPRLVVLDEATEGLAPLIREEIWTCLAAIKNEGAAILVIDKNVEALSRFADRHVVIEKGRVAWTGTTEELRASPDVKDRFLHV
ncbi:ATP-binding cassette domain-containing protein [Aurantimonas aggregata]|uniref:ATP-binding cassette domain-containing protein n=1 Tax=Aurantimonas aggregata TaxID=2047720 RepID=A0A6L9MBS2_9HYPH|nr:ABC transporter ATP-binding protein [Aurantimonas aggregata]NDV85140.1 ATP-binding cassette domain-containing protein [Aurantimonas aggregata]